MKGIGPLWIEIVQTALRMLPWPCETGLRKIGRPGRDSPVLLTGNFRLTVDRVARALDGIDAWLLVANSRGVNVWCAATGGLLTNHDVVSVLKTSGIEKQVDHRQVILPQLAATGVEGPVVQRRTGWKVQWGPVHASGVHDFLARGRAADRDARTVDFGWIERIEMAIAWAFPISIVALLPALLFFREGALATVGLVWGLSLSVFLVFPLYASHLQRPVLRWIVPLLFWLVSMAVLATWLAGEGALAPAPLLRWGLVSGAILAVLNLDLMGSTPVYKSGLHADRLLRITLEEARCKGAGFCEQVCPKDVFTIDEARRLALLPRADECVQCGACVVQCPFDALLFESPEGERLTPETVRRFKLNLMGHRLVAARGSEPEAPRPAS